MVRPFENLTLMAPKDTQAVLEITFKNLSVCKSNSYNHQIEKEIEHSVSVPCQHLHQVYPFVLRRNNTKEETLTVGGTVVQSMIVKSNSTVN